MDVNDQADEIVDFEHEFEPRADYIPVDQLRAGTAFTDFFQEVHQKMMARGTHLIVGPRGCGKTHMMRYTWLACLENHSYPFCIYVTFNRYYRLEPILKTRSNAIELFHVWMLARIVLGAIETVAELSRLTPDLLNTKQKKLFAEPSNEESEFNYNKEDLTILIGKLERNLPLGEAESQLAITLTTDTITGIIQRLASAAGRKRSVLLLDDAALTLQPGLLAEGSGSRLR